jgi:oligopeptide/dipeptide ABC transporter ATP-binding protein
MILAVEDLHVSIREAEVLRGISLNVDRGECLSLVGESGCGKTMTAYAIMGLLKSLGGTLEQGRILFQGRTHGEREMRGLRGSKIAMIFQDAMTALNPFLRVSEQLIEGLVHHAGIRSGAALKRAVALLEEVGIPDAKARIHDYPHSFSGGMLQRVMIAMALMTSPDLIIADEPTSALDVTIQAQTLKLFDELRASSETAVILITHDLGIVAGRSNRVAVMYAGRIVEQGDTRTVLDAPAHPYTRALLDSTPRLDGPRDARLKEIGGQPPLPGTLPRGCAFAPRCPSVLERCSHDVPTLCPVESGHECACWKLRDR